MIKQILTEEIVRNNNKNESHTIQPTTTEQALIDENANDSDLISIKNSQ